MLKKNNIYAFIFTITSSTSMFAQNDEESSFFYNLLNQIGHAAWKVFFFLTRIIGAIFMGNGTYCIKAITLFACIIAVEAYIMHRLTKVSFSHAALRMFIINIIHTLVSLLVILLNVFSLLITHKYLGILVLFCLRMLISYFVYFKMDKQINKTLLRKAIIITNSISFIITLIAVILMKM